MMAAQIAIWIMVASSLFAGWLHFTQKHRVLLALFAAFAAFVLHFLLALMVVAILYFIERAGTSRKEILDAYMAYGMLGSAPLFWATIWWRYLAKRP